MSSFVGNGGGQSRLQKEEMGREVTTVLPWSEGTPCAINIIGNDMLYLGTSKYLCWS
jgi:hypothetical protein